MERIVYFYKSRNKEEGAEFSYRKTDYELLRVGLAHGLTERWEQNLQQTLRCRSEVLFWRSQFDGLTEEIAERFRKESDGGRETPGEILFSCEDRLLPLLLPKRQGTGETRKEGLTAKCGRHRRVLRRRPLPEVGELWRQKWNRALFADYLEGRWVEHMLGYARLPYFLILGYHRELPQLLCKGADRIRGVKWILPERVYRRNLQDFTEAFYEEYGIAVGIQLLDSYKDYGKTVLACREPANVLDFSEEERISAAGLAEGSIWLDMASSEEKCRRVEERNRGICYFSLKKEWKQAVSP